ncbi:DarT ssDNA thymidine ADP-ribosyltransferase family protein [Tistrella bauzanensis]|uniref:DarT ssDNA thymidine ADP-ribosyltransferase family protein n=1 Tax=Tistrella bauzanensis TaxID=657419 RepID=UPI001E596F55
MSLGDPRDQGRPPVDDDVPNRPKICHIVHVDRLASIVTDGFLWSDADMAARTGAGTMIGMSAIKTRRLNILQLKSHHGLFVGECTPFYFCPRSVMHAMQGATHRPLIEVRKDWYY